MLNAKNERELCYVVRVDEIKSIEGRDRVECAVVGGWTIMVRKDQFKPGDLGIYFEIDSQVPEKEPFMFLEAKHFKIKTQKYKTPDGQFWSQGLLMSADDFGWTTGKDLHGDFIGEVPNKIYHEGDFLTQELGVTYADPADNKRKGASTVDKYKKMIQRHGKLFSKQPYRWLMKHDWGKKLLFVFFGKKKDNRSWAEWVVKTDEERIQNLAHMIPELAKERWIATEKIDGSSTTFTMKRVHRHKYEFLVCSRNVCFDKPDKKCFYDINIYTEAAEKYHIEDALRDLMENHPDWDWVTLQGETFGAKVQNRTYGLDHRELRGFNLINSKDGRANSIASREMMARYDIPWVPIVNPNLTLPQTCDEILALAAGKSEIDGGMREGLVFRSLDGKKSFKAVDNAFIVKYHG